MHTDGHGFKSDFWFNPDRRRDYREKFLVPRSKCKTKLLNYLKASGIRVGLLNHFARPKLQYRRLVV